MTFPIRVQDVMSSPVETATVETTAADAARQCSEQDINSLPVVDDGNLVGIVTGTDLLEVMGTESEPAAVPLADVMSTPAVTTTPDAPVGDAMETMRDHDIARLVVTDGEDLLGLLSTDDIIRYVPQVFHRGELESPAQEAAQHRIHKETAYEKPEWSVESAGLADDEVNVGDRIEFGKTVSEQDIWTFAAASGDTNRLHLDDEFAEATRFGRRIAHGTLVSGLISAALARLPGLTIYLSQDLSFLEPVDIGDRITAICEVVGELGEKKYELTTDIRGTDGNFVVEGQATVLIDPAPAIDRVEAQSQPSATHR